ncbi:hypothetical protein BGX38DRAFT_1290467 [Terfezia claveryi]|nr:hypothetical protein BGX38DRAFT_1290467 [Terfezia claveryi]
MNPDSFMRVLARIENYKVFINMSNYQQISPMIQLLIALRRLGSDGGTAVMSVSQLFSKAEGTVVLYTKRVMIALITY